MFPSLSGDDLFRFSVEILPAALNSLSEFKEEGGGLKYMAANFFIFGHLLACCFHQIKGSCCLGNRGSVTYDDLLYSLC